MTWKCSICRYTFLKVLPKSPCNKWAIKLKSRFGQNYKSHLFYIRLMIEIIISWSLLVKCRLRVWCVKVRSRGCKLCSRRIVPVWNEWSEGPLCPSDSWSGPLHTSLWNPALWEEFMRTFCLCRGCLVRSSERSPTNPGGCENLSAIKEKRGALNPWCQQWVMALCRQECRKAARSKRFTGRHGPQFWSVSCFCKELTDSAYREKSELWFI